MEQCDHENAGYFGRRIDLLLEVQHTTMELASNEWKSNNTSDQLLKQQSKNIRPNCAILNDLYLTTDGKISSLMAMDFIGTSGYLYSLHLTKNVYVASTVCPMILPTDFSHLSLLKDTIKFLFVWKDFLADVIKGTKISMKKEEMNSRARLNSTPTCLLPSPPLVFYTPKH
ncbi:hypothetical protein BCR42DRAFT_423677 [Absidia repens]|uniref:Uncharacterized protein n=1 Tax=Absidia repens TaxID=90262 RepID=A0A1X2I6Q4_9FUNG|nr:hypothetical protein BCR42DRAFT_423677 [Absidia repens]